MMNFDHVTKVFQSVQETNIVFEIASGPNILRLVTLNLEACTMVSFADVFIDFYCQKIVRGP